MAKRTGSINVTLDCTVWYEPNRRNVINFCIGDERFVDANGGKPRLWIRVKRNRPALWNRLVRALSAAGELHPPLVP